MEFFTREEIRVMGKKQSAYKAEAMRRAKAYDSIRTDRINQLARQLNEGYKFMITK
jgi:hypothetical protein